MATIPKDKTEEALERALFGTNESFLDSLRNHEDISGEEDYLEDEDEDFSDAADDSALEEVDDSNLFFFDTGLPSQSQSQLNELTEAQDDQALVPQAFEPETLVAWHDSDDERVSISLAGNTRLRKLRVSEQDDFVSGTEYARRLRIQFQRLNPAPEWTDPEAQSERRRKRRRLSDSSTPSDSDPEDDSMSSKPLAALLQSSTPLIDSGPAHSTRLRAGAIDIQRTKDVLVKPLSCKLALHFHPSYPILLSSSVSGQITLHHITSRTSTPNPLLTSIAARAMSVTTAVFHASGSKIYFAGRRRYFYSWDLLTGKVVRITRMYGHAEEQRSFETFKVSPDGKFIAVKGTARKGGGSVNVLDSTTCQWMCQARVDSVNGVADFAWWRDSAGLVVIGKGGEALEYSVGEKRAVARWRDEGAVGTTVIALGGSGTALGGDKFVVVGSSSGIVNVYDRSAWLEGEDVTLHPKPVKVLAQLTTPISNIVFSGDGQLLCISSQWKKDALRLVHVDSLSIYKNWPTSSTPLGRVTAVAFSSDSRTIAVGNEQGRIRLWDIKGS